MQSYNYRIAQYEETPPHIEEFLFKLAELYKTYNLSISHEDTQGAFVIESFQEYNLNWIKDAFLNIKDEEIEFIL